MSIAIYRLTSPSGNIYIGQTVNIRRRFSYYKSSGAPFQPALNRSFLKYGIDNHKFEILYELPDGTSRNVLDQYEIFFHDQFKEAGFGLLNSKEPGISGRLSEESIEKIRQHNIGKKMPEHVNLLLQEARRGKTNTPEAIRKANATKLKNGTHRHTNEARRNMSLARIGKTFKRYK